MSQEPAPTAVVRLRRPRQVAVADEPTRLLPRRPRSWDPRDVALLACALVKDRALPLLENLAAAPAEVAVAAARHLLGLDPASRRARLARDFGERTDASARLRQLFAEASGLQPELWRRLPVHHQRSHPQLASAEQSAKPPAREALVARLVREALR